MQTYLDVVDRTSVEAELDFAKTYDAILNGNEKAKPTTIQLLSKHCEALKAIPIVHLALKLGVTFGAFTAKCEKPFFVLKTIMRDRRKPMKPILYNLCLKASTSSFSFSLFEVTTARKYFSFEPTEFVSLLSSNPFHVFSRQVHPSSPWSSSFPST